MLNIVIHSDVVSVANEYGYQRKLVSQHDPTNYLTCNQFYDFFHKSFIRKLVVLHKCKYSDDFKTTFGQHV